MRIYIAAPYAARDHIKAGIVPALREAGHEVASSWVFAEHEINEGTVDAALGHGASYLEWRTKLDFQDLDSADSVLLLTGSFCMLHWQMKRNETTSGGRHIETGYALAKGKPVLVLGQPENIFHRSLPCFDTFVAGLDFLK